MQIVNRELVVKKCLQNCFKAKWSYIHSETFIKDDKSKEVNGHIKKNLVQQ